MERRRFADKEFGHNFHFGDFLSALKHSQDGNLQSTAESDATVAHWGFDPAPLLSLFGGSIADLESHGKELDERIERSVDESRAAEGEHKRKLAALEGRLEQDLILRIAKLEEKATSFTETAVQIGDRLEKIHDTKQRATECGELMQHLDELQQHKGSNFEVRRRGCRDSFAKTRRCTCDDYHTGWSSFFRSPPFNNDIHAVAKFVKQLRERALDLSSVLGSEAVGMRKNTEAFCEELDAHLQAEFFAATEHANYNVMKRCAETLEELSGLHSENTLIATYVSKRYSGWAKREAARSRAPEATQSIDTDLDTAEQYEAELTEKFAQTLKFAAQESKVVKRVFPQPEKVMAKLVERIFEDRIVNVCLKDVFSGERMQGDALLYCTTLAAAARETRELAQQLNALGTGDVNTHKLAMAAIAQFADSYWDTESAALGEVISKNLVPLADESPSALRVRKKGGASMDEVLQQVQQHNDMRLAGVVAEVERALSGVEAAIVRSAQLCKEGEEGVDDRCQNLDQNDRSLLRTMHTYLDSVVHVANTRATESNGGSKKHGQWHPLSAIRLITSVANRLQLHYDRAIVANTSANGETGRNVQFLCLGRHQALRRHIQDGVREVLESVLDGIVAESVAILETSQRREDFLIHADDDFQAAHPTSACKDCVNFINAQHYFLQEHLEADNLHSFLGALGAALHRNILDHLHNFPNGITVAGGKQMESDLSHFCDCVRSFNHARVSQQFSVLREVARLFTAPVDALAGLVNGKNEAESRIAGTSTRNIGTRDQLDGSKFAGNAGTGGHLANIPRQDLRRLLGLREDCKRAKLYKLFTAVP